MKPQPLVSMLGIVSIAVMTIFLVVRLTQPSDGAEEGMHDEHEHGHGEEEEAERGPHGGRWLEHGEHAVELVVFEDGIEPEFRLYAYEADEAVDMARVDASITLTRLGGEREQFVFEPEQDYLRGLGVVREPHSFDVELGARWPGADLHFAYESHEGRTQIPRRVADAQGLVVETAGPQTIENVVELTGTIQTDPSRVSQVRARFAGVVTSVRYTIGDTVSQGDVLATIETNESLRPVSIEAPIGGLIVDRNIQTGQNTADAALFVIADLSEVWINLDVFGRELQSIAEGQPVVIETLNGRLLGGTVEWISPLVAHGSQSVQARVTAANPDSRLRPGQFVRARVLTDEHEVPLAVKRSGIQTFRDFDVVFARVGDVYEVRMLELGRSDALYVEVLDGLQPGEVYVSENSYLIKADIEKAGASHDH